MMDKNIAVSGLKEIVTICIGCIPYAWSLVLINKINIIPGIMISSLSAAIWGGVLMGAGAGLILSTDASLAGTTMLGKIILVRFPQMKLGNLLIILDGLIIFCGAFLMRDVNALIYSIIYTVVCMKVIDFVLNFYPERLLYRAGKMTDFHS